MSEAKSKADSELRIERLIAAPPEQVFSYWTEPSLLVKWWGPEGCDIPRSEIDLRPGGRWTTTMCWPNGNEATVSGVYRKIDPPRRLEFTWAFHDDKGERGHETLVAITCDEAPGGTRLVLLQREFQTKEQRDRHSEGWSSSFNKLATMPG
jgi:uncharacterized protein YndB with AHSA1/START domain